MADLATCAPLTRASVEEAQRIVAAHVHRTPVVQSATLSAEASRARTRAELARTPWAGRAPAQPRMRLWLKCENAQRAGAFKARGAFHALARLVAEPGWVAGGGRERGVVTHSSGNHAQALALAAREHGIKARVVMPAMSAPAKMAATRGYGADVVFSGSTSAEREAVAARIVADTGARLVPPYDHPDIILGQGTLGLELQAQVRDLMGAGARRLDAVVAPCGGGGMLAGVALSCDGSGTRVFGAEPSFQGADDACRGFAAGARVPAVASLTVADGLRTPVGEHPWRVIYERRLVAAMYSAGEADIRAAMRLLLERCKLVVEPSACVPLAVVLFNEDFRAMVEREAGPDGWDVALVLSGGNVSVEAIGAIFADPAPDE